MRRDATVFVDCKAILAGIEVDALPMTVIATRAVYRQNHLPKSVVVTPCVKK